MGSLARGLGRDRRHYDGVGAGKGTLMRHFLRLAPAPSVLPGSVPRRSAVAQLVARPSPAPRFASAQRRTFAGTVLVTVVTAAADAHLPRAASAAVEPIGLLARLHAPCTQHWTTPCGAGIKALQTRPHAREHAEGPGFFPGMCPGLRLFGVREQDSASALLRACGVSRSSHIATAVSTYDCV